MPAESTSRPSSPVAGRPTRAEIACVAGIFALALALRLLNLQQIRRNDPFFAQPSVDPRAYHEWALALSRGDWIGDEVFYLGPLYPYLLGLVYTLFGPGFLVPRVMQCGIGSLTCVLVWILARRVFDRRVACIAAAMTAVYGMLIFYEGSLLIVNILTPLLLLLLLAVMRALESPTAARWLWAGVALGFAVLARQTALLFAPLAAAWLLWDLRERIPVARRLGLAALFGAGIFAALLPATIRNYLVSEDWVLVNSSGGNAFITANHEGATGAFHLPPYLPRAAADDPREQRDILKRVAEERSGQELLPSEVSSFWVGAGMAWIRANPTDFARLALRRLGLWLNAHEAWTNRSHTLSRQFSWVLRLPLLSFGIVAPLALLGIGLSWRSWRRLFPLLAMVALHFGASFFFIVLARYRAPMVPVLIAFAAAALVWLFDAARGRRPRALGLALLGLAATTWLVHLDLARENLSMAYFNLGNKYKTLGEWELAIPQYWSSLERDPSYLPAYNNLALSYESTGANAREARLSWERVLQLGNAQQLPKYVERAARHLDALEASPRGPSP